MVIFEGDAEKGLDGFLAVMDVNTNRQRLAAQQKSTVQFPRKDKDPLCHTLYLQIRLFMYFMYD